MVWLDACSNLQWVYFRLHWAGESECTRIGVGRSCARGRELVRVEFYPCPVVIMWPTHQHHSSQEVHPTHVAISHVSLST